MNKILVIGAGRSSAYLIKYLLGSASEHDWHVTVADVSLELASEKVGGHPRGKAISFDIKNDEQRHAEIATADLVISLLPADMHLPVAQDCVASGKSMLTASYVSDGMKALDAEAKKAGIVLINECGLDPGLDHMSAMQAIHHITSAGGELISFKSYTGGLVAPESNDNPWGYKFSWNPRNVILAGHGTARYIEEGKYKYIPYHRLFSQSSPVEVEGLGKFDGYANRDSLAYRSIYGLDHIPTLLRGTLRQEGYCRAWNVFVQLGLTDDSYTVEDSAKLTYADLVKAFLPVNSSGSSLRKLVADFAGEEEGNPTMDMIQWTGILEDSRIALDRATPAQILQQLLERKLVLRPTDNDMIVMQHQFVYSVGEKKILRTDSLVVNGEGRELTAMAKTVGLPLAITAKNLLLGKIKFTGVVIPVSPEIYGPVLKELTEWNIRFQEQVKELV